MLIIWIGFIILILILLAIDLCVIHRKVHVIGIAEALIATALGLFAAIPAVIFYNLLLNKLKVLIAMMEDFVLEFLNLSEKLSR